MRGRALIELQDPGDRCQHLGRRMAVAPLFEPQVVVRTDAGQHRHFFAPQAGDPAHAQYRNPHLLGRDQLAASTQILAQLILLLGHAPTLGLDMRAILVPSHPGSRGCWLP